MAEKKTRKKKAVSKKSESIDFSEVVEVLKRIDAKLDLIYSNKPSTILPTLTDVKKEDLQPDSKQHLINQSGEAVELTHEVVMEEAQKLVSINEHTDKAGFHKAREIIIGYGVTKLEDVPKENYPVIVEQFRKAVSEWK